MSLLRFYYKGCTWGIVRNQKCASTSVLSYIAQALWNANPYEIQTYNTFEKKVSGVYFKSNNFLDYKKDLINSHIRVAIYRDPVDKFLSGFYHTMFSPTGAQDALWIGPKTLDEFLFNFKYYYENSANVKDHCSSNSARLGDDPEIYTHIYHYDNTDKLANLLDASTKVYLRKTSRKPNITSNQTLKIKELMAEDYKNGWYKK